jgi:hypothetical protein
VGAFLFGSLALIVLNALLGDGAADAVEKGGQASTSLLRRALSPEVAGIPQRKSVTDAAKSNGGTSGGSALDDFLGGVAKGIGGAGAPIGGGGSTGGGKLFPDNGFSFAPGEPQPRSGPDPTKYFKGN